jgi:hypothetical protein
MSESNGISDGRDNWGRFALGNRAAAGNPINKRMRELRQALFDCTTDGDIAEIKKSLMESARSGDTAAARVLLEYLIGRPSQAVEITGPDGMALDVATVAAVVLEALGDDPAARLRVAAAFARLGRRQEGGGDGVGDRPGLGD